MIYDLFVLTKNPEQEPPKKIPYKDPVNKTLKHRYMINPLKVSPYGKSHRCPFPIGWLTNRGA